MTALPKFVHVWRCDGCGKIKGWKRRPPPHLRFFADARDIPAEQRPYIERVEPKWDQDREQVEVDGVGLEVAWVRCGPFRKWVAYPAHPDDPKPVPMPSGVERPFDGRKLDPDLLPL